METVVRTIGLKGIGDGLRPTAMRALEIVMAVVGTVLSAVVFGVLTSALVGSIDGSRAIGLADLPALRIATLGDSTSQAFLEQVGADPDVGADARLEPISVTRSKPSPCVPYDRADAGARCVTLPSWRAAMEVLARGEVDAVLGDWAQLTYLARSGELAGELTVQQSAFRLEPYGWGVSPLRPDLRAAVDRALMARVRSPGWRFVVQEYMGSGSISPD
jgi:ABC-type amino acid transport substrate-binding protein